MDREYFDDIILEPACGNGAIVKVLDEHGYKIESYDIEQDFLSETRKYQYIVTNPPYSLCYEFILKCKEVCIKKFCLLLPLSYLHGKKRYDNIYCDHLFPLSKIYVFTRYPMLGDVLRNDGKYRTGMMVYAWFVWESGIIHNPQIHWIDNNEDVIKSKET